MSNTANARESEGSRAESAEDAFRTPADKICDSLTARCLAYNLSRKYTNTHTRTAAMETLIRWGKLLDLSVYTVQEAATLWEEIAQ